VKAFRFIGGACVITTLLAGCGTSLNRAREESLNAERGIAMDPVQDGVEMRVSADLLFQPDGTDFTRRSGALLDRTAVLLKRSMRPVMIEVHTDRDGSRIYNDTLSRARADALANALIARGVPAARIKTRGMGFSQPVASNDTPDGRAANRRVEIFVRTESEETLVGRYRGK
jgi:outer membrane protein OmpA-like peptidoglycan-associated protein